MKFSLSWRFSMLTHNKHKHISISLPMRRRWDLYKHIDSRRLCRQVDLHLPPLALFLFSPFFPFSTCIVVDIGSDFSWIEPNKIQEEDMEKKRNKNIKKVLFFPSFSSFPPSPERKSANPDEILSGAGRWPREPIGCQRPRVNGRSFFALASRSTTWRRNGGGKFQIFTAVQVPSAHGALMRNTNPISAIFGACLLQTYSLYSQSALLSSSFLKTKTKQKKESKFSCWIIHQ